MRMREARIRPLPRINALRPKIHSLPTGAPVKARVAGGVVVGEVVVAGAAVKTGDVTGEGVVGDDGVTGGEGVTVVVVVVVVVVVTGAAPTT